VLRIGIDLVDVTDVGRSIARFGDRYSRRLLSERELEWCAGAANSGSAVAERLAAKEATIKVLLPGGCGLDWRSIETPQGKAGSSNVMFSGAATELADAAGISHSVVSTASAGGHAMALVIGGGRTCAVTGCDDWRR